MIAVAKFSDSKGKYVVDFPDGSQKEYVTLDDVALVCDKLGCELHYKGKMD